MRSLDIMHFVLREEVRCCAEELKRDTCRCEMKSFRVHRRPPIKSVAASSILDPSSIAFPSSTASRRLHSKHAHAHGYVSNNSQRDIHFLMVINVNVKTKFLPPFFSSHLRWNEKYFEARICARHCLAVFNCLLNTGIFRSGGRIR